MSFQKTLSREDIERRAFQLYMPRGREPGNDLADWLNAEKELSEFCVGGLALALLKIPASAQMREHHVAVMCDLAATPG